MEDINKNKFLRMTDQAMRIGKKEAEKKGLIDNPAVKKMLDKDAPHNSIRRSLHNIPDKSIKVTSRDKTDIDAGHTMLAKKGVSGLKKWLSESVTSYISIGFAAKKYLGK